MSRFSLSLSAEFAAIFGYRSEAFEPDFNEVAGSQGSKGPGARAGQLGTALYSNGADGREYYLPAWVSYSTGQTLPDGSTTDGPETRFELPYPVISIKSRKTIIETNLTERSDTVKEFINIGGYELTIRGLIVNTSNELPEETIRRLNAIYRLNAPVKLECALTDLFLINNGGRIVIKDIAFPEVRGVKGVRAYEINAVSDAPFNLVDVS